MLKPSDIEQLKGNHSRYAMVIGVAKRAREIVDKAKDNNQILLDKPVSMAIEDFRGGDYKIFARSSSEGEDDESNGPAQK